MSPQISTFLTRANYTSLGHMYYTHAHYINIPHPPLTYIYIYTHTYSSRQKHHGKSHHNKSNDNPHRITKNVETQSLALISPYPLFLSLSLSFIPTNIYFVSPRPRRQRRRRRPVSRACIYTARPRAHANYRAWYTTCTGDGERKIPMRADSEFAARMEWNFRGAGDRF